jgi:hypothetical protein
MTHMAWISLTLLLATAHNPASADTTLGYSVGSGKTSNIFAAPSELGARFSDAWVELRGTLNLEGSTLSYAAGIGGKRYGTYDFASERKVDAELGYRIELSKTAHLALRAAIRRADKGDLFLALPGTIVGYRTTDFGLSGGVGTAFALAGGTNTLTANYDTIDRGKARFTLKGVRAVRLEAAADLLDLTAQHIRPALGGEAGLYAQYRSSFVARKDQLAFARFPAETLRGSVAFGRMLGTNLKLLAEIGLVDIDSDHIGKSVRTLRPFLKAEAEWQSPGDTTVALRYRHDTVIADIDDALGEYVRSMGLSLEKALSEKVKAGIGFERAMSEWLYYDYRTRTATVSARLTFALNAKTALALEYSHLIRHESDRTADFTVDGLSARLSGTF